MVEVAGVEFVLLKIGLFAILSSVLRGSFKLMSLSENVWALLCHENIALSL